MSTPIGFIGLGKMGEPMALNMARAGTPLIVWNRSAGKQALLAQAGASTAETVDEVFASAETVIVMLANGAVIDDVLGRGTERFSRLLQGHTLVHMGTTSPQYSRGLADDVAAAGGRYVEAPVSGSRRPAEDGRLVAMVAADDPNAAAAAAPLLKPMCVEVVDCGKVPDALVMKLSVNLFLITLVTGLAEAFHFAARHGIDPATLQNVLAAGPMASDVSRTKGAMLVEQQFDAQASLSDVLYNNRLIFDEARASRISTPLLDVCHSLFKQADALGHGAEDMAAVIRAIEASTNEPNP